MQKKIAHRKLALAASRKGYKVQIHVNASTDNLRLVAPDGKAYATTLKLDAAKGYTEESVNAALADIRNLNCAADENYEIIGDTVKFTNALPLDFVYTLPGIEELATWYDIQPYRGLERGVHRSESWQDPWPATETDKGGLVARAYPKREWLDKGIKFPWGAKGKELFINGYGHIGPFRNNHIGRSGSWTDPSLDLSKSKYIQQLVEKMKKITAEFDPAEGEARIAQAATREELLKSVESWALAVYRPYVSYPLIRGAANPRQGTAGVTVGGIPKEPGLDVEALLTSPEAQAAAAQYGLTISSVEPLGTRTLPMSWGKIGDTYKVHFTF